MPVNYTQDEFDKKFGNNYTQDEFDAKYNPGSNSDKDILGVHSDYIQAGPYSGETSDLMFSQGSFGRIMHSFGEHAKAGWDGTGESLYKSELDKEAKEKDIGLLTGVRNAFAKPLTAGMDTLMKLGYAIGGGISGLVGQAGEELSKTNQNIKENVPGVVGTILGIPSGYAGEVAKDFASGAGLEGHFPEGTSVRQGIVQDHLQELQKARANGQLGEGEAGVFKVKQPSPEDISDRQAAAEQAGIRIGPPTLEEWMGPAQVPTIDALAKEMNPDLYNEIDRLQNEQENLRASRDYTTSKILSPEEIKDRGTYLEQERLQKSLQNVPERLQGIDEKLRDTISDQRNAESKVHDLLGDSEAEQTKLKELEQEREQRISDLSSLDARDPNNKTQIEEHTAKIVELDQTIKDHQEFIQNNEIYRKYVQAKAFENALAYEDIKPRAEEQLRLANDLVDSTKSTKPEPEVKVVPGQDTKAATGTGKSTAFKKKSEVKIDPIAARGDSLRPIKGTGEKKPLTTNQRLELDSVIKGWKSEVGDVPEKETMVVQQQITDAMEFADSNPSMAEKVAMGDAPVPGDVNVYPEAVLRVLKNRAEETGDSELGLRLANTKLGLESRTMGQRLNLLRGMYDIDPVGIIQDLNKLGDSAAAKRIKKVIKDIQAETDKAIKSFKPDLDAFLTSIECE